MSEQSQDEKIKRRTDWRNNNRKITKVMLQHFKEHKVMPSHTEIAKLTELSESTVYAHFEEIDYAELFEDNRKMVSALSEPIFMSLYNQALKGNTRAIEMLMQINYKWAKPMVFEHKIGESASITPEELVDIDKGIEMLMELKKQREANSNVATEDTTDRPDSPA